MPSDTQTSEYALQPVPSGVGISGWRIALIKTGIVIALPAFIMGAELGFALGFWRSVVAFGCGAAILFVLALGTSTVGARTRLSTAMLMQFVFGSLGARVVSVALAITLTGWFGVTAQLFGESLDVIAATLGIDLSATVYVLVGGALMILSAVFGIRGLQRLADMAVPVLLLGLGAIAFWAFRDAAPGSFSRTPQDTVSVGVGISAVVGAMAAGVTILPDLCRFASSPNHGRLAAFLTLALGVPTVLTLSAVPSVATGEGNLIAIMMMMGLGVPALLLLLFTAWTTNSGNLYSASLMMATVTRRIELNKLVIMIGIVGMGLAIAGISDYLIPVLLIVGYSIPPIASIYIVDFFVVRKGSSDWARHEQLPALRVAPLLAWGLAIVVAVLSSRHLITVTTIPACDSILTAAALYLGFYQLGWCSNVPSNHDREKNEQSVVLEADA